MGYSMFGPQPSKEEKTVGEAVDEHEAANFDLGKEDQWRYDHLLLAGFTESQALFLALARDQVDLHKAVDLAGKAGPALAYEILI